MNPKTAALLVLLLAPCVAKAQQGADLGLDLTHPEDKKSEERQAPANMMEETPGTAPAAVAPAGPDTPATKAEQANLGERDITQEDRVKSVQRKVYLKKHRVELAPSIMVNINDPFYLKWGVGVRVAYYLADTLAISARGMYIRVNDVDDVTTAKKTFHAIPFVSRPDYGAMGDLEWSPIYGKVSFLNSILHLDGYVLGGAGVVHTETSGAPLNYGPLLAYDLGIGFRFVAKDFLAVNVGVINTSYVDQPLGTTKGTMQNMLMLNVGVSMFFPFKSTGREAE